MPRTLSNRYEIGPLIGSGGSARVHEARDTVLDRRVAVKVLDSHAAASNDPARRDRFLGEAKSAAGFSHPGAVSVFDAGDSDGELFIVMEFVDGHSLAQLIATESPMPESRVVPIGVQLLEALGAAHAAGYVHRDVKPANVLVDRRGGVKLADFGIAKRFDELAESLTSDGMVIGSPRYLAPEQAAGREVTPASDLYAVGVVLYEMLCGERPPLADPSATTGPDVRAVRADVSPAVAETIARALTADPADRYASAADMVEDLTSGSEATTVMPVGQNGARANGGSRPSVAQGEFVPTELLPAVGEGRAGGVAAREPAAVGTGFGPEPAAVGTGVGPEPAAVRTGVVPQPAADTTGVAPSGAPRWMLVAVVLAALAITGLALAANRSLGSTDRTIALPPADAESAIESADEPAAEPAADPAAAEPAEPSETPSLPTTPPGTELIPGFAATDDIEVFIEQLREGRDVVGKKSKKLADELQDVLFSDDGDRGERADELMDSLEDWVDDGEIDPAVAARALDYLRLLRGA